MHLVFGARFAGSEASSTLAVLIWLLPLITWRRHYSDALIALRHQGEELACSLFGLGVLVALTVNLRPSTSGISGGAWAMVVAESAGMAMTWWRLRRYLGVANPVSPSMQAQN
jgi:O-antigen/teichoic acid export membrane protein